MTVSDSDDYIMGRSVIYMLRPWDPDIANFDLGKRDLILNYSAFYPRHLGGGRLNRFDQAPTGAGEDDEPDVATYLRTGMAIRIRKQLTNTILTTTLSRRWSNGRRGTTRYSNDRANRKRPRHTCW